MNLRRELEAISLKFAKYSTSSNYKTIVSHLDSSALQAWELLNVAFIVLLCYSGKLYDYLCPFDRFTTERMRTTKYSFTD